jgi:hypothetical protein
MEENLKKNIKKMKTTKKIKKIKDNLQKKYKPTTTSKEKEKNLRGPQTKNIKIKDDLQKKLKMPSKEKFRNQRRPQKYSKI